MTEEIINKITKEIRERHHQIIDDWCKAYMAQLHQEGHEIKPGSFTLNEMVPTYNKNGEYVRKYWFECNTPKFDNWIKCSDRLPDAYQYVLVLAINDKPITFSIARQFKGHWEMLSTESQSNAVACSDLTWYMEPDEITHWMPLPDAPKEQ